jgi:3'-5' exoribonuclease
MARKYIADIQAGDSMQQAFLVQSKQLRTQRNGSFFLDLELVDRTGVVPAKMWDATQVLFESFAEDGFILVKARGETYRRKLQLVVTDLRRMEPSEVDIEEFLPRTTKDVEAMLGRLGEIARAMSHEHLRQLVEAFLADEDFVSAFRRAPGGVSIHHAWLGGLLEHTLAVTELALGLAERYPNLNRDLLAAGAIVHDIGKIAELGYTRGFRYTDAGGLVGHLTLGAMMVAERAAGIEGFPDLLLQEVQHLILSHHGQHAYGSPLLPATAEAVALHHIDNIDAKLIAFDQELLRDQNEQSTWTEWSRVFDRRLFKRPARG